MSAPPRRRLMCRLRRPGAALRLYCFPHAGGSPGEYVRWADRLPPSVEVWGVQLRGRGSRLDQPPAITMEDVVEDLVTQDAFMAPYVFLGHSLGAYVAYETACALRDRGRPEPALLVVSSNRAPQRHRPPLRPDELDCPELPQMVAKVYGPPPFPETADPELRARQLALLRADLSVAASYCPRPRPALSCPVVAQTGDADDVGDSDLAAWAACTTGPCTHRTFGGGHFYFRTASDAFFSTLTTDLAYAAAQSPEESM